MPGGVAALRALLSALIVVGRLPRAATPLPRAGHRRLRRARRADVPGRRAVRGHVAGEPGRCLAGALDPAHRRQPDRRRLLRARRRRRRVLPGAGEEPEGASAPPGSRPSCRPSTPWTARSTDSCSRASRCSRSVSRRAAFFVSRLGVSGARGAHPHGPGLRRPGSSWPGVLVLRAVAGWRGRRSAYGTLAGVAVRDRGDPAVHGQAGAGGGG